MDFSIKPFYYCQLEASVPKGSMAILVSPEEKKKAHTRDQSGQLSYYELKGSQMGQKIKLPGNGKPPATIQKMSRGGKISDRVMTAFGSQAEAYNSEGKQYFTFDSNISEVLKWAVAEESKFVFVCGEFILNFFEISTESIEDKFQFICPSEIMDIYIDSLDGMHYHVILACKDRKLRVVNDSGVLYETKLDYTPGCLYPYHERAYDFIVKKEVQRHQILVGLSNGEVRCYTINQFDAKLDWSIKPMQSKSDPVILRCFDLQGNKTQQVIVTRSDGVVEIWSPKQKEGSFEMIAYQEMQDTVSGIEGAFFNDQPQLIVATFSGKIMGLTLKSEYKAKEIIAAGENSDRAAELAKLIAAAKAEVDQLENQVTQANMKNQKKAQKEGYGGEMYQNKVNLVITKTESLGNKFELNLTSQKPISKIVLKKPKAAQVSLANAGTGIIIENPPEVVSYYTVHNS